MKDLKNYRIVIICEYIPPRCKRHFSSGIYWKAVLKASAPDADIAIRNCKDMLKFTHHPSKMYVDKVVQL